MKEPWYTYSADYTWVKTKKDGISGPFDLISPVGRRKYFDAVVGEEIQKLRAFLQEHSFVAYLLAPKNAGKGTYAKGLQEALGGNYFVHVSVGDVVRDADQEYRTSGKDSDVYQYALENYRGYIHLDEVFEALVNRTTASLVPTEFILTLIKRVMDRADRKTVFIDGFPRNLDQIAYSLYFRELINYRQDPDLFILINAPLTVLDERIKYRVVCPECKTPRSLRLAPTSKIGYDKETKEFYLMCDQPGCSAHRMIAKENDDKGIEPIKDRILMDIQLMERARNLYGIPKVELYNSLETDKAYDYCDRSEFTESYTYSLDDAGEIKTDKELWEVVEGDKKYYSLLPYPVVTQLIKQLVALFKL